MTNNDFSKEKLVTSTIAKELYNKLFQIWDDEEFAIGVITMLKTDEKLKMVLKKIDEGMNDSTEILWYCLAIKKGKI